MSCMLQQNMKYHLVCQAMYNIIFSFLCKKKIIIIIILIIITFFWTDQCSFVALVTTLEPNLKVQWKRSVSLSIPHLIRLDQVSRTRLPTEAGKIRRLLLMLQDDGILEEGQYMNVLGVRLNLCFSLFILTWNMASSRHSNSFFVWPLCYFSHFFQFN